MFLAVYNVLDNTHIIIDVSSCLQCVRQYSYNNWCF